MEKKYHKSFPLDIVPRGKAPNPSKKSILMTSLEFWKKYLVFVVIISCALNVQFLSYHTKLSKSVHKRQRNAFFEAIREGSGVFEIKKRFPSIHNKENDVWKSK